MYNILNAIYFTVLLVAFVVAETIVELIIISLYFGLIELIELFKTQTTMGIFVMAGMILSVAAIWLFRRYEDWKESKDSKRDGHYDDKN
jgi:membrane protein implicated in regulation of membrane protease activity